MVSIIASLFCQPCHSCPSGNGSIYCFIIPTETVAVNGIIAGVMSSEADSKPFSYVSLLLGDDEQTETEHKATSNLPHRQKASPGQPMGSNFGPMVAGQSETQHIQQQAPVQFSNLNEQLVTSDPPQHQEASLAQLLGSNFGPMVEGHSEALHGHLQKSGELSGGVFPKLFTYGPPHHHEASLGQLMVSNFGPIVAGKSQALHFHQHSSGQFSGANAALMVTGNLEAPQACTQATIPCQNHQAALVAGQSQFQAWPIQHNNGLSAASNADIIPQVYPYDTYESMAAPHLMQNLGHASQHYEIQHPQHFTILGSQMNDLPHGQGTDALQVALMPWQHRELREQQPNPPISQNFEICDSQVLPATSHAKLNKGKALMPQTFGLEAVKDLIPSNVQELSAGSRNGEEIRTHKREDDRKYCAEHSSEQLCRDSRFSCRPVSLQLKMSENYRRKCKNVISKIGKRIKEDGHIIVPLIADLWRRDSKSTYKMGFVGIRTLNFDIISQRLNENGFGTLYDFIKEVQSMLKGVADDFRISFEVVNEVNTIHDLFFEYLECAFDNTNFSIEKKEVEFSSSNKVSLLSKGLHRRPRK